MPGLPYLERLASLPDDIRLRRLEIITDSVFPHLTGPRPAHDKHGRVCGYKSFAPCHPDAFERSLSVSIGSEADGKPVLWNCFACCKTYGNDEAQRRTRHALIEAKVPVWALKWSAGEAADFADQCSALLKSGCKPSEFKLYVAALLESYDELPSGAELESLAARAGVSPATAYRTPRVPPTTGHRYLSQDQESCQEAQVRRSDERC